MRGALKFLFIYYLYLVYFLKKICIGLWMGVSRRKITYPWVNQGRLHEGLGV